MNRLRHYLRERIEFWRINLYVAPIKSAAKYLLTLFLIWLLLYLVLNPLKLAPPIWPFLFGWLGVISFVRAHVNAERLRCYSETQSAHLDTVTKRLDTISQSMSTRRIHSFPYNLEDIIILIKKTREHFHILADCADYGSFSDPERHELLIKAIEEKKRKQPEIRIEVQICGKRQPISRSSEFWGEWRAAYLASDPEERAWKALCDKNDAFHRRLVKFCNVREVEGFNIKDCSKEDFKTMMLREHEKIVERLRKSNVSVIPGDELEDDMPGLFFWLQDGMEAVFVLSHSGGGAQGVAFYTHDAAITNILETTWNHVKEMLASSGSTL